MFTHFTWLKFALWNVLQNTESPQSSQLLSTFTAFWGGVRDANSHILKHGTPAFPFLYSTCFSPFSSTALQIHVLKCILWAIHDIFLNGIVKTKRHSYGSTFPISINFAGPIVFSLPTDSCCSVWAELMSHDLSSPSLSEFHRVLGVEQECCHGKKKKKNLLLLITS